MAAKPEHICRTAIDLGKALCACASRPPPVLARLFRQMLSTVSFFMSLWSQMQGQKCQRIRSH
uniref:Uncharacterized protein n=1 Tax=Setaria italica TaxID=4555 RepID=K4A3J7_SETIT